MPRRPRINEPGITVHAWANGIAGSKLFRDGDDRDVFLRLLRDEVARSSWICLAYVLMSTHYHLLIRLKAPTLSSGFQRLNVRYARHLNQRTGNRGRVFLAPFYSNVLDADPGAELEVARYFALNPTRANMCRAPEDYPWSSYGSTVGLYPDDPIVDTDAALAPVNGSRTRYRAFVEELDPRVRRKPMSRGQPARSRAT